jgi:hypothetical protein
VGTAAFEWRPALVLRILVLAWIVTITVSPGAALGGLPRHQVAAPRRQVSPLRHQRRAGAVNRPLDSLRTKT